MEQLEKGLKGLRGFAAACGEQQCQQARPPPQLPETGPSLNQRIHMVLATYVAEDGLVGHQWEERPLGLRVFDAPV